MDMFKHFLKWSQKFLRYPLQTSKIIFEDYQKQKDKSIYLKHNFVWCIGLPKSGTTFIEEIFESLNYLSLTNSPFRICKDNDLQSNCFLKGFIQLVDDGIKSSIIPYISSNKCF